MGKLIALEGLDGAGKRTLVDRVVTQLRDRGVTVAVDAFPRYGQSVHADLGSEALRGRHGDLADSVHAMALMWALDRRDAAARLRELLESHDLVLLDRYVASNAAYGAARMHEGGDGEFVGWVTDLEFGRFGATPPELQLLLDVPVALAAERARSRGASDATRELDAYERDSDLQTRTGAVYRELASARWVSPWWVLAADLDPAALALDLAEWM
ncbi:dTMP kinase [Rhodococcus kronopolitis]|uniref:Thymidylate kinase n=1 Tax=Rhodococcus kronopolitis TaxID=1460226 RepID=A0ABV9FMJ6_9NOCA